VTHIAGFDRRDFTMLGSLFRMSLIDRFLGSGLGLAWALLSPLMLMGLFIFVFSVVFPGRLPGQTGSLPFVIWLISGYAPWLALSEGLNNATSSVVSAASIIRNVAFKSELLPLVGALLGLAPLVVGLTLLLVLLGVDGRPPALACLFLPVAVLLQLMVVGGLGLFLAALNVFVRDTALALPNLLTLLLFASPIFYPLQSYPEPLRPYVIYSPFYAIAELYRAPIMAGTLPPLWIIAYVTALGLALMAGGLWWFRRLKSFFDSRL
jgi:ABC-type polysaccharide/polyol phosphate export permease